MAVPYFMQIFWRGYMHVFQVTLSGNLQLCHHFQFNTFNRIILNVVSKVFQKSFQTTAAVCGAFWYLYVTEIATVILCSLTFSLTNYYINRHQVRFFSYITAVLFSLMYLKMTKQSDTETHKWCSRKTQQKNITTQCCVHKLGLAGRPQLIYNTKLDQILLLPSLTTCTCSHRPLEVSTFLLQPSIMPVPA